MDYSYGNSPGTRVGDHGYGVDPGGVVDFYNGVNYYFYGRRYRRTRVSSDMHGTWNQVVSSAVTTSTTLAVPTGAFNG